MSINPLLNEQGTEPLRLDNEYFILKRNDIYYKLTSEDNGKHEGEGILFLTSNRLVIIPTKHNSAFKSLQKLFMMKHLNNHFLEKIIFLQNVNKYSQVLLEIFQYKYGFVIVMLELL